jgi:uncharacterized membrane protein YtjA (UPF0391 family)
VNGLEREDSMLLKWAAIFFVIALIAAAFGFTGIAAGAASIAKVLFYLFLGIFVVFLIAGIIVGNKVFS